MSVWTDTGAIVISALPPGQLRSFTLKLGAEEIQDRAHARRGAQVAVHSLPVP